MVFHMLRWEMGDDKFNAFLKALVSQNIDKSVRTTDVQTVAEAQSQLQLTPFFSQWLDGTGAPEFGDTFSVFRMGSNKGFPHRRLRHPGSRPFQDARGTSHRHGR